MNIYTIFTSFPGDFSPLALGRKMRIKSSIKRGKIAHLELEPQEGFIKMLSIVWHSCGKICFEVCPVRDYKKNIYFFI